MKPQRYRVKLLRRKRLNNKFYILTLQLIEPKILKFNAGQYLSLKVAKAKFNPYSIASFPEDDQIVELCIDISPGGPGSQFAKLAKLGLETEMIAPLGKFKLAEHQASSLFVATGSGISPLRPMITDLLGKETNYPVRLYWGLRLPEDVFWQEEWQQLKKKYANFGYHICLSKPNERWRGKKGYVTEAIRNDFHNMKTWNVYLCGNGAMIEDMKHLLVKKQIEPKNIYMEKYF